MHGIRPVRPMRRLRRRIRLAAGRPHSREGAEESCRHTIRDGTRVTVEGGSHVRNQVEQQVEQQGGLSRTQIVWLAFTVSMSAFGGIFVLTGPPSSLEAAMMVTLEEAEPGDLGEEVQVDTERRAWRRIVIHDSGFHFDDHIDIDHRHRDSGLRGSGYHFVIGNGGGQLADGRVVTTPRWTEQRAGAHIAISPGTDPRTIDALNRESIGIVLVGDGDTRRPTPAQMQALRQLIVELQEEFGIVDGAVLLHSDVSDVSSPGRYFPAHELEKYLARQG